MKHHLGKKLLAFVLILVMAISVFAPAANASFLNPSIYTLSGTVYADTNSNGIMELHKLDLPQANMTVTLHKTQADAIAGTNVAATAKTNAVGVYNFTKLQKGTYFVKYGTDASIKPIAQKNSALDAAGKQIPGVSKITINTLNIVTWADLATKKVTNLTMTPFEDLNVNGLKDANESVMNGKTIIFLNLEKTAELIQSGRLSEFDLSSNITSALSGSLDIEDAILFRTSSKLAPIALPEVDPGMYVMIRSPFNLTLGDLIGNLKKINALVDIISGGDIQKLLDDPTLLDTGDASTTPDNEYIKALATFLPKAIDAVEKVDVDKYLGTQAGTSVNSVLGDAKSIANLLNHIPAMRFAKVDIWGNTYDLTALKFTKTTNFDFGIRKLPTIKGNLYIDANNNGILDSGEKSKVVALTIYDKDGKVLRTVNSASYTTAFTIDKIPFNTDLYLGVSGTDAYAPVYNGTVPEALKGIRLVGKYNFSTKTAVQNIQQDIRLLP
ncbi:repeat-containing protein [Listeria weihenstephanensis FSL R9-0317]|uniref:SD-repeat containing protein B domain-containing protein n=1 Tax=Listeria weihenstephanensis TaxID=1006155 RepID=A0A1S7FXE2_9LIST|nr:SdrD B-like domain-containing protein [Listeria weihenstephanensis]AQY52116.1 hypothetical protein UE46_14540 [Listeria weihenstephanensis]EUJ37675.1 repeat-containing protein [Listeria weihenstephanensis FSL R9-0317]